MTPPIPPSAASGPDPAEAMRTILQADLRRALKLRAADEAAALRVLIAAIDNAGAVPLPPRGVVTGEVERARLGAEDVQAILLREHQALQDAATEFRRVGCPADADRASAQAAIVARYVTLRGA